MTRRARRRGGKATKPRNPLVSLTKQRGQTIEISAKAYRRRPKHTKPPHRDGGFDVLDHRSRNEHRSDPACYSANSPSANSPSAGFPSALDITLT